MYYITISLPNRNNKEVLRKEIENIDELFDYEKLRQSYLLYDEELEEPLMMNIYVGDKILYRYSTDDLILSLDIKKLIEIFPKIYKLPTKLITNELILSYNIGKNSNKFLEPMSLRNIYNIKFTCGDSYEWFKDRNLIGISLGVSNNIIITTEENKKLVNHSYDICQIKQLIFTLTNSQYDIIEAYYINKE